MSWCFLRLGSRQDRPEFAKSLQAGESVVGQFAVKALLELCLELNPSKTVEVEVFGQTKLIFATGRALAGDFRDQIQQDIFTCLGRALRRLLLAKNRLRNPFRDFPAQKFSC